MSQPEKSQMLSLYRHVVMARQIDRLEQAIANRGEAFFQLSGSGHEATAALAEFLTDDDWLHCHYRSRALLLARGIAPRQFLDNLVCNGRSTSRGKRMSAFFNDPTRRILSMVTPVGNNALQAVGVAETVRDAPGNPFVLCGLGDGTTQQGEFQEACGEATRRALPVLFLVENNRWAISTKTTGATFIDHLSPTEPQYHGIPVTHIDGRDILASRQAFHGLVEEIRSDRRPQLAIIHVERLTSHTSADDQTQYRSPDELQRSRFGDPIPRFERALEELGCAPDELAKIRVDVASELDEAERLALEEPPAVTDTTARISLPMELTHPSRELRGHEPGKLTMREALRNTLAMRLRQDERVVLFGQDIEDPKGDVFGVTKGLSSQFPGRVLNAPLSESTIVGTCIGRALGGERPVAMIQFADFLPLAYNQIVSELATLHWRTSGRYKAPVVILAACGAYRPGLGPYHAQTGEAVMAHTPGLDVMMPSTACDAAGLLNAAFRSERPTLILYPKAILNDASVGTSPNLADQCVPIGPARKVRAGRDITFVSWGNTVSICSRVAATLESVGVEAEILDLRCLSPWDDRAVLASAEKTARLVVVHEDNLSAGFGAEVVARVAEQARVPVVCRRVARPDTHVPCHFGNQMELLPTFQSLLEVSSELLDLQLKWQPKLSAVSDLTAIEAVGSGPSDDRVDVIQWLVQPGDSVERGTPLASVEASKSVFDMTSTVQGTIEELVVPEGSSVAVGQPIAFVRSEAGAAPRHPLHEIDPGTPVLSAKPKSGRLILPRSDGESRQFEVGISSIATVEGGREISNQDLLCSNDAGRTAEDIIRRTGIERRCWVDGNEDAISMAAAACERVLEQENLILDDLDLLVCSTTSPSSVTPSMACRVLNQLARAKGDTLMQAFDINAACSGYLYALQAGWDYLQSRPQGRVLVVTTEVLSPLLDPSDFDTAILFGDAASATVLYGEAELQRAQARLQRPEVSAKSDGAGALSVPLLHDGFIQMQGRKVFTEAVRSMVASLNRACQLNGINVDQLDMIVPHQANQRILDAIQHRIRPTVYSNIRDHGNTSSTSIPLCLSEILPTANAGQRFGLCAFGGGFTFGAGILERN